MRQAGPQHSNEQTFSQASLRGLRLAAIALGVALVMSAGAARAGDDDDEDAPETTIMDNLMAGIGARPQGDTGIKYRERSPLVVPSKIALPPPADKKKSTAPNWPKDPDEAMRKAALEDSKKAVSATDEVDKMGRPLLPSELVAPRVKRKSRDADSDSPGAVDSSGRPGMLSPSQLGYNGGMFTGMFRGNAAEDAPFKGEPERESLAQPPVGYQTPSPKYRYGMGPVDSQVKEYNPAAGKYGDAK